MLKIVVYIRNRDGENEDKLSWCLSELDRRVETTHDLYDNTKNLIIITSELLRNCRWRNHIKATIIGSNKYVSFLWALTSHHSKVTYVQRSKVTTTYRSGIRVDRETFSRIHLLMILIIAIVSMICHAKTVLFCVVSPDFKYRFSSSEHIKLLTTWRRCRRCVKIDNLFTCVSLVQLIEDLRPAWFLLTQFFP